MSVILVVDDDDSPRRGLVRLLQAAGHSARGFASGHELLRLSDAELADVCLITDARMVAMPPEELHRALRKRGLSPVMIMVTADNRPETRMMARAIGASAFFTKPVDGVALLETIAWVTRDRAVPAETFAHHLHHSGVQPQPKGD